MVDRHDIDALLISALYGELTPADEARLHTHLDSHPADRTALADLTLARNAVRESRILTVQLEPPQSVSALLLQEAARRAPKQVVQKTEEEREGWFKRFVRSFASHPAMAAAAMLVIVVGVAGTMYMRKDRSGDMFAEQTATTRESEPSAAAGSGALAMPDPAASVASDASINSAIDESKQLADKAGSAYGATFREDNDGKDQQGQQAQKSNTGETANEKREAKRDELASKLKPTVTPAEPAPAPATVKKPAAPRTDLVTRDGYKPQPKDLVDQEPAKNKVSTTEGDRAPSDDNANAASRRQTGAGGSVGAGSAARPETAVVVDAKQGTRNAPQASPPPPPASVAGRGPSAEEQKRENEDTWAKDTHGKVVAAVRAKNCPEATKLALSLSNRAPGYYQSNVENDRAVKQCATYINAEREKEAARVQRARATEQRRSEDAKQSRPSSTNKQ